jgi:hypothetical protein
VLLTSEQIDASENGDLISISWWSRAGKIVEKLFFLLGEFGKF